MRRSRQGLAALALAVTAVAAGATGAFAATTTTPTRTYEVVAANFGKAASAAAYEARLAKAGLTGFTVEKETVGKGHYQVERSFTTSAAATSELAKLHARHFFGGIEVDVHPSV